MDDSAFAARLAESQGSIERELENLLELEPKPGEPARPKRLMEAMRYATLGGGKRLRPFLTVETARALGRTDNGPKRAGAAIECIHAYSLIHDDLPAMDDDDLRRGRPTTHRAFDEATAILAGDGLQALAFEILADPATDASADVRVALCLGLARAAGLAGMVGGQMLDIDAEKSTAPLSVEEIRLLQAMKTGALLKFSVEAGAILAGASAIGAALRLEFTGAQLGPRFRSPTTFSTSKATRRRSANAPARTPPRTRAPWSERLVSKARAASSIAWWTRRSPRSMRPEWAPRATSCARLHASSPRGRTEGEARAQLLVLRSAEGASRRMPVVIRLAHWTSFEAVSGASGRGLAGRRLIRLQRRNSRQRLTSPRGSPPQRRPHSRGRARS